MIVDPERRVRALAALDPVQLGRLHSVVGLHAEIEGLDAAIGDLVQLGDDSTDLAEVISLHGGHSVALPYRDVHGLRPGTAVRTVGGPLEVPVGDGVLGRVLDGLGRPMDDGPPLRTGRVSMRLAPPNPLDRPPIDRQLQVGVRSIDALIPCGRGQRVGIFAGSGVGKSNLLSMMVRGSDADVAVIALVGERGREVVEFIERDLGPEGMAKAVVVVATSDTPALVRRNAALTATRIAEHFRDTGNDVLLVMDSVTRFAMAQREIGLSAGEVPASRGYTPSVFAALPQLLERAGRTATGSITAFYTVLVEGDDLNDPVADAARSMLDGHIVLSRDIANAGRFPAVDVLQSASRVATSVRTGDQLDRANKVRSILATWEAARDLVEVGAYQRGSDPAIDEAIERMPSIARFLVQPSTTIVPSDAADAMLSDLLSVPTPEIDAEAVLPSGPPVHIGPPEWEQPS
ncbi:MAG: FliI/YscN family ATPase [Actinomycetia bacterium]|nr:FliI/YscN family ATPase [Actinomycetes bacterium]MCP4085628.1 FliI/YscN family ATPase [Actinomycetes bacterium]